MTEKQRIYRLERKVDSLEKQLEKVTSALNGVIMDMNEERDW
jgi:hypothetical protein